MTAYEYFGKSKLPRGFSYPVSYSAINALIEAGAYPNIGGLWFTGGGENRLVWGQYSGPRSQNETPSLSLWISAVPSAMRQQLNGLLIAEGLPALSAWASRYSDPTSATSQIDHTFTIRYHCAAPTSDNSLGECHLEMEEDVPHAWNRLGRYRANIRHNSGGRR